MAIAEQQAAFTQLEHVFREHHERVLRAAYRITGSMADAEDVAQAVFLRLARGGTAAVGNVESYLYRAAINGALDLLRRRVRENTVELDEEFQHAMHAGPESHCEAAELSRWLRQALAALDPKAAEMFVLRHIEDRDLGEIARVYNTSRAVVAVTLHRTRRRLRNDFDLRICASRFAEETTRGNR